MSTESGLGAKLARRHRRWRYHSPPMIQDSRPHVWPHSRVARLAGPILAALALAGCGDKSGATASAKAEASGSAKAKESAKPAATTAAPAATTTASAKDDSGW